MIKTLPEPLQRLSTVLGPSVTQQPQWRLGNPPESEEEDEAEEGRNEGDKPPVEDSSQAVGDQHSEVVHQHKQRKESSSSLDRTVKGEVSIIIKLSIKLSVSTSPP